MAKFQIVFFLLLIFFYRFSLGELPGYLALKVANINMRTGPADFYDIKYIYIKKYLVFKILNSLDDWYQVEDIEGERGWIKQTKFLHSKKLKFTMVRSDKVIECYKKPNSKELIFKAEHLVIFKLQECQGDWCLVSKDHISAWCNKKNLWGE